MGGFFGGGSQTVKNELDPAAREILESVLAQTRGLQAQNPPFVAPLDAATIAGLQSLQDRPESSFIPTSADQLNATLGGDFFGQNPGVTGFNQGLQGVTDAITDAATRAVGDQFSLAGRTGSPAQSVSLAKTIANQLAPFQFGAFENQLGRQFSGFENERQRQLSGLSLAPTVESIQDSQAQRLLGVGDIIQRQNQNVLTEPLRSFEFFINPLLSVAGGLPVSSTQKDIASGREIVSGIGGVLGGLGGLFSCSSALKENFETVEPVLDKIARLDVRKWNYKPEINLGDDKHISPMAEDFAKQFGGDGETIDGITLLSVLLKGIQELAVEIKTLKESR